MNIFERIQFSVDRMRNEGMEIRCIYLAPADIKELQRAVGSKVRVTKVLGIEVRESFPRSTPRIFSTHGVARHILSEKYIKRLKKRD